MKLTPEQTMALMALDAALHVATECGLLDAMGMYPDGPRDIDAFCDLVATTAEDQE